MTPEAIKDFYEERIAIMHHDGNVPLVDATEGARLETIERALKAGVKYSEICAAIYKAKHNPTL